MGKHRKTAKELLDELKHDENHQALLRKQYQMQDASRRRLQEDEENLVSDLRAIGIEVDTIWDLVNTGVNYKEAIAILTAHLHKPHESKTLEGIVRALTVPEAKGVAAEDLIELFESISDASSELKWLTGAAIAETATPETAPAVAKLAEDKKHGRGRYFLPLGLVCLPNTETALVLEQLARDDETRESAERALRLVRHDDES